jgi:hypothetical protein
MGRLADFASIVVDIADVQPDGAVVSEDPFYLTEHRDEFIHIIIRRLFQADLVIDPLSTTLAPPTFAPAGFLQPSGVLFSGRRERFIGRCARATHGIIAVAADMLASRITTDPFAGLVIA